MTRTVAVAVSGGRDSMALLHCTARAAQELGIDVIGLHVHHGLQPDADAWAQLVERSCTRWSLRFAMQRLDGRPAKGESVEAWARKGRYRALAALAREAGTDLVLLAHHQRDQAETFLLQALRGAGPAGLSAMPRQAERAGIVWARPWLNLGAEMVAAYARRHRLRFVEDPSNTDPRFARGRLRNQVTPALRYAFPDADALLAASAARCAEAEAVLGGIARADLAAVGDCRALRLAPWRELSLARRRNALRAWLRDHLRDGVALSLVDRLMEELPGTGPARWPCGDSIELRRYRGRLEAVPVGRPAAWPAGHSGELLQVPVTLGGIALDALKDSQWRARMGGEQFQRAPGTPPRSLKKQFQTAGIPAWQRDAPLLYSSDGRLLFVPGLGIDARALATPGQAQVALSWERPN